MTEGAWRLVLSGLDSWASAPVLFVTAFIETVFPPFPGDVLYIVAGGIGFSGGSSPWILWIPGFFGCGLATFLLDEAGRGAGPKWLERFLPGGAARERGMERARSLVARYGGWALFLSRFIPGIRSLLVVAASWSGMGRAAVLVPSLASAVLWYALLSVLSVILGVNIDSATAFMAAYGRIVLVVLSAGLILFVVHRLFLKRRVR